MHLCNYHTNRKSRKEPFAAHANCTIFVPDQILNNFALWQALGTRHNATAPSVVKHFNQPKIISRKIFWRRVSVLTKAAAVRLMVNRGERRVLPSNANSVVEQSTRARLVRLR